MTKLPISLPDGWTAEESTTFGVVISADNHRGFVTVDERLRGFTTGMAVVRTRGNYAGRNWKAALYNDAVAALKSVID